MDERGVVQNGPLVFESRAVGPRQIKRIMMAFAPTSVVDVTHLGIVTPKKSRKKV